MDAFKEALGEATGCQLESLVKITCKSARLTYIDTQRRRTSVTIIVKPNEGLKSPAVLDRCIRICQTL